MNKWFDAFSEAMPPQQTDYLIITGKTEFTFKEEYVCKKKCSEFESRFIAIVKPGDLYLGQQPRFDISTCMLTDYSYFFHCDKEFHENDSRTDDLMENPLKYLDDECFKNIPPIDLDHWTIPPEETNNHA
jgi:hypothetical protein